MDIDVCRCHTGYNGSACNETSCESLGYCSGICSSMSVYMHTKLMIIGLKHTDYIIVLIKLLVDL